MGLLKKIKKMFSKNIDCTEELNGRLLYLYNGKKRQVNVGASIIVPEGFFVVFVCKNKVTDVILPGKYAINGANLPLTFERMKMGKVNKKGKYKKKFNADIYYISNAINNELKFVAYNSFKIKSERLGRMRALSEGLYNMQVIEPDKMLKYFLSERAVIDEKLFLELLGGLVGYYVNNKIMSNKEDIIEQLAYPNEYFNNRINDAVKLDTYFNDYGVRISKVRVEVLHTNTKKNLAKEIEMERAKRGRADQEMSFNIPIMIEAGSQEEVKQNVRRCNRCGSVISDGALFCDRCERKNNLN